MKRIFLVLLICLTINECFGQLEFRNSSVGRLVNFEDLNGHSLLKKYEPGISGSPFLNDDWVFAKITLSRGKEIGPILIKLNIESNELFFLDSAGKELIAVEGLVKKIDYSNFYSKDSIRYVFKSGYTSIDKQNENFLYQVFTEGKVELLGKKIKYISTTKDAFTGENSKDFVEGGNVFYLYANNTMQVFHPNKNFVISVLKDKERVINNFIYTNNLNLKKTSDLIRLFNYYNSL